MAYSHLDMGKDRGKGRLYPMERYMQRGLPSLGLDMVLYREMGGACEEAVPSGVEEPWRETLKSMEEVLWYSA